MRTHEHGSAGRGWGRRPEQIIEKCRQQRLALLCEREALQLTRVLHEHEAREGIRAAFQREADAVARRLIMSVGDAPIESLS